MKVLFLGGGTVIIIAVVFVIAILIIGSRLPETHTVTRSIRLKQSPGEVYAVVRNVESSPAWRHDVKSVEITGEADGHTQFREIGANGVVNFQIDEDVPNKRLVTRIVDRDRGYGGSWTYEFAPEPEGTLVIITENGEVPNIFFRFISRYIFGPTSTLDKYLRTLGEKFGEPVEPV